jgi:hypothetical protein
MTLRRDARLQQFIRERGPTEPAIARIVRAVRTLIGEPIKANQLFNLGDDGEPA